MPLDEGLVQPLNPGTFTYRPNGQALLLATGTGHFTSDDALTTAVDPGTTLPTTDTVYYAPEGPLRIVLAQPDGTTVLDETVHVRASGSPDIVPLPTFAQVAADLSYDTTTRGLTTYDDSATLALTDAGKWVLSTKGTSATITIPKASGVGGVAFPVGTLIRVTQAGAGAVTIAPAADVTLAYLASGSAVLAGQHGVATLIKTDTNTWLLSGDLAPAPEA